MSHTFDAPAQAAARVRSRVTGVRFRRELALGAVLLFGVIALAYPNILFFGETLVSTANHSPLDYRFDHLNPGSFQGARMANWHDQGGVWWQWEPAAQFFGRMIRHGIVPMWDPLVGGGIDSHVNVERTQYFLPAVLLLLAGNTPLERDAYYLLLLLASGVACFALLRRNGFDRIAAVFMGAAYMLSGAMTQNISGMIGQTSATLPIMLLAMDILLDRPTWRAAGGAALIVGLCTYSSFLPIVISGYVLMGIQAMTYAVSDLRRGRWARWGRSGRQILAFGSAMVVAIGLASWVLLPLALAQQNSQSFEGYYAGIGKMAYGLDQIPTLLSPRLFYDVWQTEPSALGVIPKPTPFSSHFFYVGFLVLLVLPLLKLDERPRIRRLTWFFALSAAAIFAKLMGIAPAQWLALLPVFRYLHFVPYFSGALSLALAGLAACGVESLLQSGLSRRRFLALAVVATTLLALVPLFIHLKGINPQATAYTKLRYKLELLRVVAVVAAAVVTAWLCAYGRMRRRAAGLVVLALLLIELVPIAFHRRYGRADVWRDPPRFVQFLESDPDLFRVHSIHDLALPPNTFEGVGLSGISSLDVFNQPRYTQLIDSYFSPRASGTFILPGSLVPSSRTIMDLLNVKYVVTFLGTPEQREQILGAGLTEALVDGLFSVYRNPTVWPRAYVAYQTIVVPDTTSALKAVGELHSPDTVILEEAPTFTPAPVAASPGTVSEYDPDRVVITGETPRAGMLVLLDSYGVGWSAAVNGRPVLIHAANAAFRGVEVPAGRWEVTMTYQTPMASAGFTVSALSLVLALSALAIPPAIFAKRIGARS